MSEWKTNCPSAPYKTSRRILLTIAFLLLCLSPISAVNPALPADGYIIDQWGPAEGFPSNYVFALMQSTDGYLWLGTDKGLVRYDGRKFKTFSVTHSKHWDKNTVYSIIRTRPPSRGVGEAAPPENGDTPLHATANLWAATSNGLFRSNGNNFKPVNLPDAPPTGKTASKVFQDSFGTLWTGTTNNGLYRLSKGMFKRYGPPHKTTAGGLNAQCITFILEDDTGGLWVGGSDKGLFYGRNEHFLKYKLSPADREYSVYDACIDNNGTLWVATNHGLVALSNPHSSRGKKIRLYNTEHGLKDNCIRKIHLDSLYTLWVGTAKALHRMTGTDVPPFFEICMDNVSVHSILEDNEKSLWVGTGGDGLKRLRDATIKTYSQQQGFPGNIVFICKSKNTDIWMGDGNGNLHRYKNNKLHKFLKKDNKVGGIRGLGEDASGNLWFGTLLKGLYRLDVNQNKLTHYDPKTYPALERPRAIVSDSRGRLWIGTSGKGVTCRENETFTTYTIAHGLAGNEIYNIYEDKKHNLWFATNKGLNFLENGKPLKGHLETFLPDHFVMAIYEDPTRAGTLWVGSMHDGLIRIKEGKTSYVTKAHEATGNSVFQIVEDTFENFWLSGNNGITRINKKELCNHLLDPQKYPDFKCTSYDVKDGMKIQQCTPSARNSIAKTPGGELWFATRKGIVAIRPENVTLNRHPPPVVMEKIAFNGKTIPITASGNHFKGISNLEFHFSAITFIKTGMAHIQYMLQGVDEKWQQVPPFEKSSAFYRGLPSGNYVFKVIAANNDGVFNREGISFSFSLGTYFYQTLLFKIFLGVAGIPILWALAIGFKKYRLHHKLKKKYRNSTLNPNKTESILKKLNYLFEIKEIYKDDALSIRRLARKLKIKPRVLSQIINEQLNRSFSDLVNSHRIEAAKRILNGTATGTFSGVIESILDVGLEVGFNSKATFNRAFKKNTGLSPSRYKEKYEVNKKE
ncbi:MAG: helix-turn-helix domain-containing protein [bacterium]|nr:helix-turn-helix domain-containing protein [bacterium]